MMTTLSQFRPLFIEEPTSPDDILGHAAIREGLADVGVKVATGEMCHNKVMFKQFLTARAMDYCQVDSCRLGGLNEVIAVLLMAAKVNVGKQSTSNLVTIMKSFLGNLGVLIDHGLWVKNLCEIGAV